jgi:DNA-binding MarR family transcriptional regulator
MAQIEESTSPVDSPVPDDAEWVDPVERIIADWQLQLPGTDASPLRVIARLARLETLIAPHLRAAMARHGLNIGLFDVLAALRRKGEPYRATPSDLAISTMLTTGGMTGRVDHLEKKGLIERHPSKSDRRVMYVQLTRRGVDVVDRALEDLLEAERDLLAGLTRGQMDRLSADLADLEQSIDTASRRRP